MLNLWQTHITGVNPIGCTKDLSNLETLSVYGCPNLTDKGLGVLLHTARNLKALKLSYTNITGAKVDGLSKELHSLRTLDVSGCIYLTDEGLCELLSTSPNLEALTLTGTHITGRTPSGYKKNLGNLKSLNIFECRRLTDKGLCELLGTCSRYSGLFIFLFSLFH